MQLQRIQFVRIIGWIAVLPFVAYAQPAPPQLPPVNLPSPGGVAGGASLPMPASMPPTAPTSLPRSSENGAVSEPSTSQGAGAPALPIPANLPPSLAPDTAQTAASPGGDVAGGGSVPKQFSYGSSSLSILFLPAQMERMKSAIRTFESSDKKVESTFVAPTPVAAPVEEKIEEPQAYPVFYLASIAYDADDQWSLWISGHKITARKNDTDISVLSISRDSATFLWKPEFMKAVVRRKADETFAPTEPVKNKLATAQRVAIDDEMGGVRFTLRQNQSFAAGYFSVFEGFVETPKLDPILASVNDTLDLSAPTAQGSPPPAISVPPGMSPQGMVKPPGRK